MYGLHLHEHTVVVMMGQSYQVFVREGPKALALFSFAICFSLVSNAMVYHTFLLARNFYTHTLAGVSFPTHSYRCIDTKTFDTSKQGKDDIRHNIVARFDYVQVTMSVLCIRARQNRKQQGDCDVMRTISISSGLVSKVKLRNLQIDHFSTMRASIRILQYRGFCHVTEAELSRSYLYFLLPVS